MAGLCHEAALNASIAALAAEEAPEPDSTQESEAESPDESEAPSRAQLTELWRRALRLQLAAIARDRRSAGEQRRLGAWLLEAHRALENPAYLPLALAALERAVELYPNDSSGRAELAWAYHLAGDDERAADQAAEALRLDDLNPHEERQLQRQDLFRQRAYLPEDSPRRLAPSQGNPREWMERLATPPSPAT
jgi:hypothetical protein